MSVLECSRNGCTNIMCDRCNPDFGYICEECFEELLIKYVNGMSISEFMDSPKCKINMSNRKILEEIFPDRSHIDIYE
jgi:uncharacterized protein YjaG (DUF416 family)